MPDTAATRNAWPNSRYAWFVVIVLMTLYIFSFIDRMIISLLVAPIKAELRLSDTQIGMLHGLAFALFYTFVGVFLARIADSSNRVRLIAIGVLIWGSATAAAGLAAGFASLFIARIVVGIGEATLSPAAYSLISDYFPPEKRARAMSLYTSGIYFGVGAALIFGSLVIGLVGQQGGVDLPLFGDTAVWRAVFFVVGLPGVFFCLLVLLAVREPARQELGELPPTFAAFRQFFRSQRHLYLRHYVGFSFLVLYSYCLSTWTPTFLVRTYGLAIVDAGFGLGVIILVAAPAGVMAGSLLAQRLRPRYGNGAALRVGAISAASTLLPAVFFTLATSAWAAFAFIAITQFLVALPFGIAPAVLHEVTPNQFRGQVIALYLFFINLVGFGMGPLLVGVLTDSVFQDESLLRYSMLVIAVVFLPLAAVLLARAAIVFRDRGGNVAVMRPHQ